MVRVSYDVLVLFCELPLFVHTFLFELFVLHWVVGAFSGHSFARFRFVVSGRAAGWACVGVRARTYVSAGLLVFCFGCVVSSVVCWPLCFH